MKIKCHRIDSEDIQNLQRYIHVINILICIIPLNTLLKPRRFPALFSLKTKLLCVFCVERLHSTDRNTALYWFCQEKRWSKHCCVSCDFTLLWHTSLWSACATYYYNTKYFWKIKPFLTNFCDFIKYIMQYHRVCVTAKLQLASSYTWKLMRLLQHFYLNQFTLNHYWVSVITSDCEPMWILVKWWGKDKQKIHSYNFCGAWRKSNITSSLTKYCC